MTNVSSLNNAAEPGDTAASYEIWRIPRVVSFTGLAKSTIYARIANGIFPSPISLGGRACGWKSISIIQWVKAREAETKSHGRDAYLYINNPNHSQKLQKKMGKEMKIQE